MGLREWEEDLENDLFQKGNAIDQTPSVGMPGGVDDVPNHSLFDLAASVHHHHPVRKFSDNTHIMGDENDRGEDKQGISSIPNNDDENCKRPNSRQTPNGRGPEEHRNFWNQHDLLIDWPINATCQYNWYRN